MTVVNPQTVSYLNRSSYISPAEFKRSPIAAGIDVTQLVPGGDLATQDHALNDLIAQASAHADTFCLGAIGTLCATVNVETGRYRANRQGWYIIHPAFWPILEVRSFQVGPSPATQTTINLTTANCWIEQRQFVVTSGSNTTTSQGPLDLSAMQRQTYNPQFCSYSYVNGFFNQPLAAQAVAGSTSLTFPDVTGLYVGSPITIYDAPVEETVQVASSWDGNSTTVPITAATRYAHGAGTNVSALPPTVKQAVIHLVVSMIKQRGQGGLVLNEVGAPTSVTSATVTSMQDQDRAYELLTAFKQVFGRI